MSKTKLSQDDVRNLYERHGQGLLAYACSFLGVFASAEDVLHQVFERLLRGDLQIEGPPLAYLYRAVRNASINYIRNRKRETELDTGWLDSPSGSEHMAMMLESALRELPDEQREAVALHIWGRMSFDEIAAALGISPNTAASRYRYGISRLREQFQVTTRG